MESRDHSPTDPRQAETDASRFMLDTSGEVAFPSGALGGAWRWSDLTPFCQGYTEALFASLSGQDRILWPFVRLAPATLSRIIGDCEYVVATMRGQDRHVREFAEEGAAFWRARQDRGSYGLSPPTVSLGEDGLIYLAEAGRRLEGVS